MIIIERDSNCLSLSAETIYTFSHLHIYTLNFHVWKFNYRVSH